ncbi:MAG: hypothetical protein GX793_01660 [Bacteroidales bacterium]|nr:hypothetical protein [Bacteroidales bacterium]MCK9499231.1 hypothetical protein [Bacteroidales bacterium]MDY0313724.1 hypothetical protein [Bacteroidales bacterium]NLB85746.1 hypothetical protein [Bacteroidales bacterium]
MNNNLKNLAMRTKITFLVLLGAFFFLANTAEAQKVINAQKFVKSRGVSEYVIPSGDLAIEKPALSRGGCLIKFDNWTGYYVDLWVDKVYKGRLNPWENSQLLLPQGYTEVYCRTMGETYQWQSAGKCNEEFLLKLEEGSNAGETSSESSEF